METIECIRTRRSIRKFADTPLEFEKVGNVLDAGRCAPSAGNLQDWKFILVTESNTRQEIAEACLQQYWMNTAPVHIIVCAQPDRSERFYGERGRKIYSIQNCSAVAENMIIAAHDQGLGACWVSAFDESMIRRTVNIPESASPQVVVVIGYADEHPPEPPKLNIENVVYIEKWGSRIRDMAAWMEHYSEHVQKAVFAGKEFIKKGIEKIKQ